MVETDGNDFHSSLVKKIALKEGNNMKEKLLHALQHSQDKHLQGYWRTAKSEDMAQTQKRRKRFVITVNGEEK